MSKALKALEKIDHTVCLNINKKTGIKFGLDDLDNIDCKDFDEYSESVADIRKELEMLENNKMFKALEIIKNKNVDVAYIRNTLIVSYNDALKEYNTIINPSFPLTKEEFCLLKEVFSYGKKL